MTGVLMGFFVIAVIVLIGYLTGRSGILGPDPRRALSRLSFSVLTPCLLLTVLADADVHDLFSTVLVVSAIAAVAVMVVMFVVSKFVWRRPLPEAMIGTMAAGYVNANNIGIPVAVYVLGDPAVSAPVILLQQLVFTPIALAVLDTSTGSKTSPFKAVVRPLANPILISAVLGVLMSVFAWQPPEFVMEPFRLIGAAAVPVVLISFGMSLSGERMLQPGTGRRDVILSVVLKLAVMPLVAWVFGAFVFDLSAHRLFVVVVLAALPGAQNVFNYAQRYERGETVARDSVLITTVGAVPVLLAVAALLAG